MRFIIVSDDPSVPRVVDVSPWMVAMILPDQDGTCRVHVGSGPWSTSNGTAIIIEGDALSVRERITEDMRELFGK